MTTQSSRAIGLIGPGRAGVGLALALARAGYSVCLHGRNKKSIPKPLSLTVAEGTKPPPWIGDVDREWASATSRLGSSTMFQ